MPPKAAPKGAGASHNAPNPKKRKEPPTSASSSSKHPTRPQRGPRYSKTLNARSILTQPVTSALVNGELDVNAFLKAREFEINALEDGISRSKGALTTRAFQQVPRDMRRRTASHNVKRVAKRLQKRARREMKDDNTPTVRSDKRKPSNSRGWLRAETVKKLSNLAAKRKSQKAGEEAEKALLPGKKANSLQGRVPIPKATKGTLKEPQKPKSKFRKRQIDKTWLPTHLFHAKRATMTEPKNPLWRFALPLTTTEKGYRPTHRAGGAKGAVCWDMSYISTIGLEGSELALEKVLRAVGMDNDYDWQEKGQKWRSGQRTWSGWLSRESNGGRRQIGPATIIWCSRGEAAAEVMKEDQTIAEPAEGSKSRKPPKHRLLVRIHPSSFLELWNEVLRISKMQRPVVHVEDLRFEVGSIEVTGPGATEALLGTLHPYSVPADTVTATHAAAFRSLAGVTNASALPPNSLLTFNVLDPRLRYPPRKVELPRSDDADAAFALLESLSNWTVDQCHPSPLFFDRIARHKATLLPSQKAINRRKGLALPGSFPDLTPADPAIPILLYNSRPNNTAAQGTYTVLMPWKCVLPIWYTLMRYPLSSGGNPRFGGLQEIQQLSFEQGKPWFPGDFPGTDAGWAWELDGRERRKQEWDRRPRGKRVEWTNLDLGNGRRGEIGVGWGCDFEKIIGGADGVADGNLPAVESREGDKNDPSPPPLLHLPTDAFRSALAGSQGAIPHNGVATVRIDFLTRGVPQPCARIYRLPSASPAPATNTTANSNTDTSMSLIPDSNPQSASAQPQTNGPKDLRTQWLSLLPTHSSAYEQKKKSKGPPPLARHPNRDRKAALTSEALAASFFVEKEDVDGMEEKYPLVPGEEDLIGFVTTGSFNLAEGKGSGFGSLVVRKVVAGLGPGKDGGERKVAREDRLCIVRNAGESVGRLAMWESV